MEISVLTLKLIILLTPGVLAATIHRQLTIRHKEQTSFMFVIHSIMLGMFSYLILQVGLNLFELFCWLFNTKNPPVFSELETFRNIVMEEDIPYMEIIGASLISTALGFIVTKIDSDKWIPRFAKWLKVSNKYGEENLFSYFLNNDEISWVYIRDIENNLTYLGNVQTFSETAEFKEIVLNQVTVLSYPECEEMYEIESVYLCFPKDKVKIEQAIISKPIENGKEPEPKAK